jgi:hypothetical protein
MAESTDRLTLLEQSVDRLVEISRRDEREPAEIQAFATLLTAQALLALVIEMRALRNALSHD